jgi:hypothetical protein
MDEKTARKVVKLLAIFIGALTTLIGFLTLYQLNRWKYFSHDGVSLLTSILIAAILNLVLIVSLGAAITYGLLKKKNWARWLAVAFCALVIVDVLLFTLSNPLSGVLLIFVVMAGAIIWLLCFEPAIKKLFKA